MIFHDFFMRAILKKMAISSEENALRVADFLNRHSQFENRLCLMIMMMMISC